MAVEAPDPNIERQLYEEASKALRNGGEYDSGRATEAIMARHHDAETVLDVLRDHQLKNETFVTNGEQRKDWRVSHLSEILQDREEALQRSFDYLVQRGLVQPLDPKTQEEVRSQRGGKLPIGWHERYMGIATEAGGHSLEDLTVDRFIPDSYSLVKDENGKPSYEPDGFRKVEFPISYFGTLEQRKETSEQFADMRHELLARNLIMSNWGVYQTYAYALNKLAEGMYFGSVLSNEGLGRIFNLRSAEGAAKETVTGVELRSLGDKIETAMRLYYVAALCEKPTRFKDLMGKPGWKQFLFPDGTSAETIEEWVGKPDKWEKEAYLGGNRVKSIEQRKKDKTVEDKDKKDDVDIKREREDGLRGKLTQKNIFAETNTYFENKLHEAVREFLGGEGEDYVSNTEAKAAQGVAYRQFRLLLLADKEGFELYKQVKNQDTSDAYNGLDISYENAPAASDFGKLLHPDMYIGKSYRKNRDSSPILGYKYSRTYYPRFMVDFLRHTSIKTAVGVLENGVKNRYPEERSLMEMWWGYEGGLKVGNRVYEEELATRLGDLPWEKMNLEGYGLDPEQAVEFDLPAGGLHNEVLKNLYLSGFMAGGEKRVFDFVTNTLPDERDLVDEGWWKKFYKMLDVGIRPSVALDGEFRGKTVDDQKIEKDKMKNNVITGYLNGILALPIVKKWDTEPKAWGRKGTIPLTGEREDPGVYFSDRIIRTVEASIPGFEYKRLKEKP